MKLAGRILVNLILFSILLFCILPFWWVFVMSTLENGTLFSKIPMIPSNQLLINIKTLFNSLNILTNFMNSVIIGVCSTAMNLFFSSLAAYAFSKHQFKGKEPLFLFIMITMFIPTQLSFVGFVQLMKYLKLINTLWPMILPSLGSAFGVFMIRGYMTESIPNSLVEAAKIDGCQDFNIFIKIVLPLCKPVLASVGILSFMTSWNNYSTPLVVLFDSKKFTLPLALATLNGIFNNNFSVTCVGIIISTVPILIVYVLLSKFFISSLTSGAVKE